MSEARKTGTIARLFEDRVYGFIFCPADKRDYFFHQAQLIACPFRDLTVGDEMSFIVAEGLKGIEAQEVRRICKHEAPATHARRRL